MDALQWRRYAETTVLKWRRIREILVISFPVMNQQVVANCYSQDSQTISELFKSAYFRSAITQVQEYKLEDVIAAADRLNGTGRYGYPR